ncbi:MAG: CPBP family intramembrane glutamic endopeptidase [Roseiflexaceae bacterium]
MTTQWSNRFIHHLVDMVMMVVLVFGITTGIAGIWAWLQFGEWPTNLRTSDVATWVVALIVLIQNAALVGYVWWRGQPDIRVGWQFDRLTVVYTLVGVPLLFAINIIVGAVFVLLDVRQNQAASYPLQAGDISGQLLFGLAAAVIAPLGEEIVFRGYWLQRLQMWWGSTVAIIVSSLLFAVAHSWSATEGAWVLVAQTLAMGVILAWLRMSSGSIWPAVFAHAANNALAISVLVICLNNPELGCAVTGES